MLRYCDPMCNGGFRIPNSSGLAALNCIRPVGGHAWDCAFIGSQGQRPCLLNTCSTGTAPRSSPTTSTGGVSGATGPIVGASMGARS